MSNVKQYIEKNINGDKLKALNFVGDLLAGNLTVDVSTEEVLENGDGAFTFGEEFRLALVHLGVKTVPIELLQWLEDRETGREMHATEVTIRDIVVDIASGTGGKNALKAFKGLLASLIDGCTQVQEDGVVYDSVIPTDIDVIDNFIGDWVDAEEETAYTVNKIVELIGGVVDEE